LGFITARYVAFIGDENASCAPAFLQDRSSACRSVAVSHTLLEERLTQEAEELRKVAETLPPGTARDLLLRKARQDETAIRMNQWLNSPGLRPPI